MTVLEADSSKAAALRFLRCNPKMLMPKGNVFIEPSNPYHHYMDLALLAALFAVDYAQPVCHHDSQSHKYAHRII